MQTEVRRFYRRYHLLTFILPAFASAALIYSVRLAGIDYTFEQERALYFFWGTLFMLAGAFSMPYLSALGFRLTGVPGTARSPDPAEQELLRPALAASESLQAELQTKVLELGEIPFLAVGGQRPSILWIGRQVLHQTAPDDLACLVAHEKAHLSARGWFDDVFAYWVFFTMSATTLSVPFPVLLKVALLAFSPLLLIRLRMVWSDSREREADKLAAEAVGRERYAQAMCRHLAQFEPRPGSRALRLRRLRGMGFSEVEAAALLDALA